MPIRQAAFSEDAPALPFVSLRSYLLRRLIAIFLLAVFGLPVVSPLFAATQVADSGLPACCRRNGKHHCMMKMEQRRGFIQQGVWISSPAEKCPYYPGVVPASHSDQIPPKTFASVFAAFASQPVRVAQTASKRRIVRGGSRQKRGPPWPVSI
jgi:hypothetical protein